MSAEDVERVRVDLAEMRRTFEFAMTFETPREASLCMVRMAYALAIQYGDIPSFDDDVEIIKLQVLAVGKIPDRREEEGTHA